jgi:hypothetical protein
MTKLFWREKEEQTKDLFGSVKDEKIEFLATQQFELKVILQNSAHSDVPDNCS